MTSTTEHTKLTQGLPVPGYRPQTQKALKTVEANKLAEEDLLRHLDRLFMTAGIDQRWLALGRSHIEQGFMAINRAVFCPNRVQLPEDLHDKPPVASE